MLMETWLSGTDMVKSYEPGSGTQNHSLDFSTNIFTHLGVTHVFRLYCCCDQNLREDDLRQEGLLRPIVLGFSIRDSTAYTHVVKH